MMMRLMWECWCEDLDIRDIEASLYPTSLKPTAAVKLI